MINVGIIDFYSYSAIISTDLEFSRLFLWEKDLEKDTEVHRFPLLDV